MEEHPVFDPAEIGEFVSLCLEKRNLFLDVCERHGSPLYLLDEMGLKSRAQEFLDCFQREFQGFGCPLGRVHYAVKSNNHPEVLRILCEKGMGLDVSSGEELDMALRGGAASIVFSGPGKTEAELDLAMKHADRVILLVDSFGELERLGRRKGQAKEILRVAVRLTVNEEGLWRKFGIGLDQLDTFIKSANEISCVCFQGLQFHTSWNLDPGAQTEFIARLGQSLSGLDSQVKRQIEFIDIGGGIWPACGEWLQRGKNPLIHSKRPSEPLGVFAREIRGAIEQHVLPHVNCEIWLEPGRWLCHEGMHILLTVVDKKAEDIAITDGGTNAIGWERFETDYFPVINLSRPALTEHPCHVLGSLCTPHDVWGYGYFGEDILPGDVLLIPMQGAYTYSMRQRFIKPLPAVVVLQDDGTIRYLPCSL